MKEIIKIPVQSAEEGVSSIGFEGINFQNSKNRRTIQGFYKSKRNQSLSKIDSKHFDQSSGLKRLGKDDKELTTVDFYFVDKQCQMMEEKR